MRWTTAVGIAIALAIACDRVCGELEPLRPNDGGSSLGGAGAGSGIGGGLSGGAGDPGGSAPVGGEGGASCVSPVGSVMLIDFDGVALGEMSSEGTDTPANVDPPTVAGTYEEEGDVSLPGEGFSFHFIECIDASEYEGVRFEIESLSTTQSDREIAFSIVTAQGEQTLPSITPSLGRTCMPFGSAIRNRVQTLRWEFALAPSDMPYFVDIIIDDVALYPPGACNAGTGGSAGMGTGGVGGTGGRGGVAGT